MRTDIRPSLLMVVGNNAVGKSMLISHLGVGIVQPNSEEKIVQKRDMTDWIVSMGDIQIPLNIKERSNIESSVVNAIVKSKPQKTVIVHMIRVSAVDISDDLEESWAVFLSKISTHATIVLTCRFDSPESYQNGLFSGIKKKWQFVEYITCIKGYDPAPQNFDEIRRLITQIFINSYPGSLDFAKLIISENAKTKEPVLDLGRCGLTSLNEVKELFNLKHLKELVLSNEYGVFENGEWQRIVSSNKGTDNILYSIPEDISKLKNLEILICGGNWNGGRRRKSAVKNWHIIDLFVLKTLDRLSVLNVSNNDIENVNELKDLKQLTFVHLNNNRISFVPDLSSLTLLTELNVSNNKIESVQFAARLPAIKTLDLHSNDILDLTPLRELIQKVGIKNSKWEIGVINVYENPLEKPNPQVIDQGKSKVIAFFKKAQAEGEIDLQPYINQDIKLILVGNSNAGKSSLLYWLKRNKINKNIKSSHWMVLDKWNTRHNNKEYSVNVFDFGGQEYYHDTHYLFFTNNTAYIILWETETNNYAKVPISQKQPNGQNVDVDIQAFPLQYWLESISFHTKRRVKSESEKSLEKILIEKDTAIDMVNGNLSNKKDVIKTESISYNGENVLIAQNKVDNPQSKSFLDQKGLKEKYPDIFDFITISIHQKLGLDNLKAGLFQIFDSLTPVKQQYLGTWGAIKEEIEIDNFSNQLSIEEFKRYCNKIIGRLPEVKNKSGTKKQSVLFDLNDTESFAQFLCDIGILLYYPESAVLKKKVFVNQKKVLQNIYLILKGLVLTGGVFDVNYAAQALNSTKSENEVTDTIELMSHFKIIFEHPVIPKTYIAPLYLPETPGKSVKIFASLFDKPAYRFFYEKFLFKNIILDFFSRYGKKALRETEESESYYFWKKGLIVKDELTEEIVMVKFNDSAKEYDWQAYIDVFTINPSANGTFFNKIVTDIDEINEGINAKKCVSNDGQNFVPIDIILENEKKENWVFHYKEVYYKLIDFKKYFKSSFKMKKIFISYSKQDFKLVTKFIEHLSALQRDGKVSHWYCSELEPGTKWEEEIQKRLDESDIACFMISPNFMRTEYIHEFEIARAFEKRNKDANFKIIPIILDFCRWTTKINNLGDFTALPYTAKPVVDFDNQNMAWYIIEECLRQIIDKDEQPLDPDYFFKIENLPTQISKIYGRIIEGKVDKNSN